MRIRSFATALAATAGTGFGLSACAPVVDGPTHAAPLAAKVKIIGSFSYPQRIALPADAVLQVILQDVSIMDIAAPVLAEQKVVLNGRQVPLAYELSVDAAKIAVRGMRYAVAARVTSADGRLLWSTDTTYTLPDEHGAVIDMGNLPLVQVSG